MARRLAREEGLFIGWSCGSAVAGALDYARENLKEDDVMVVILPDHGTRYLGKIYNDDWMKERGFLENRQFSKAVDIAEKQGKLITVSKDDKVSDVINLLNKKAISQIPVQNGHNEIVGSIVDSRLLKKIIADPSLKYKKVEEVMEDPFPFVAANTTVDTLSSMISKYGALLVRDEKNTTHIITEADLLSEAVKN